MAFGGNAGAPAGLLAAGAQATPIADTGAYDADGNLVFTGGSGAAIIGQAGSRELSSLIIDLSNTGTPPLAAFVDATVDGSAADTGVLVTAAAGMGEHGLPINFGAGQGAWTDNALRRLRVSIEEQGLGTPALNVGNAYIHTLLNPGNDLVIVVKNVSGTTIEDLRLRLEFPHSLTL